VIAADWIERVRNEMPELPGAMAERFQRKDGLPAYDATMMTQSLGFARYYEAARDACDQPKLVANWLMGEVSKRLNAEARSIQFCPVAPGVLAALIARIADGTVSNNAARQVFEALWNGDANDADAVIASRGLQQVNDSAALDLMIDQVLAANAKTVDEYRAGKDKAFNALVGQVMKASQGKANPTQVNDRLKKKLAR
jgi:aspartyl-tRNA(Asn)/glutamyl-tRNA(Gln) amidotransferase subunit B